MKNPVVKFDAIALAACLLFSANAMAQTISSIDHQAGKTRVKAEYKADKKACDSLASNAKDICVAQAKGKENVALAELDDGYKPTLKTHYKVAVSKAEAAHAVAKEKCDDLSGNPKDVCVKEAKAALTIAKVDANTQMKTAAATANASEKSASVQNKASNQKAEIRSDASAEKREAQYKVEKEKCDAFASTAKDNCLTQAKANFGKL